MVDNNSFRVSVVIPAYNVGKFIARTLDSVLAQTRRADEIIVVDDGSTDETSEVVARYGDKVKYIRQENAGVGAARNTAIKAAQHQWIAFLDGDDEWLPEKLQRQMELLGRNPHLDWTTGNFYRCLCMENRRGPDISSAKAARVLQGRDYLENYFTGYMKGLGGWTGTMLIRKNVLEEAGLFRIGLNRADDLDMWWRIAYRWPQIGYTAQPLAIYHMQIPDSLSQGYPPAEIYCDLIKRHLQFAAEAGRLENFQIFAAYILRRWLRSMLFQARTGDIRNMVRQFNNLLPCHYQAVMYLLTVFPRATRGSCHLISRLVQRFKLRNRIVRRPGK